MEDGKDVYAALEKKAELYEKLSRGELNEEEAEMYNVDFFRKGLLEDERLEMEEEDGSRDLHGKINDSSDLGSVHTRSQGGWIRDGASGLTQEHKQIIRLGFPRLASALSQEVMSCTGIIVQNEKIRACLLPDSKQLMSSVLCVHVLQGSERRDEGCKGKNFYSEAAEVIAIPKETRGSAAGISEAPG